jgi:hypothetical protein
MGALIASRFNPSIEEFYGRGWYQQGEAQERVALVASRRKLVVILDALIRECTRGRCLMP